jgi:hypothetical protein
MQSTFTPSAAQGILWGILPMASAVFALLLVILLPERRRIAERVEFPATADEEVTLREAR